jgi:sarcosine oxidase subunit alpha
MLVGRAGTSPQGHVTAAGRRILEGGSIALAHLLDGHMRRGEVITVTSPTRGIKTRARVTSPHFYDPAGERYRD